MHCFSGHILYPVSNPRIEEFIRKDTFHTSKTGRFFSSFMFFTSIQIATDGVVESIPICMIKIVRRIVAKRKTMNVRYNMACMDRCLTRIFNCMNIFNAICFEIGIINV